MKNRYEITVRENGRIEIDNIPIKARPATVLHNAIRQQAADLAERDARIEQLESDDWLQSTVAAIVERAERAESELARLRGQEPVAWMWNDELGIPHASAGSKKPIWLESSASAEYIRLADLRPLYAEPMPAKETK